VIVYVKFSSVGAGGQERLGPSYVFISLVLGALNRLVWWEVPLGYIALRSFLFLQEQIKDIIIIMGSDCVDCANLDDRAVDPCGR
jgi:hypothetical protein